VTTARSGRGNAGWLVLVVVWLAGGLLPTLRGQVSFRAGQVGSGGTNPAVTVGNLSQVRWLDREGARSGPPITFVGVVTYSESQWKSLFVHDGTGSAFVYPPEGAQAFHAGDRVEVQGRVTEGYSAAIRADRIRFLGRGELPEPVPTELSELDTGRHDCERVRVTTTIRWMFSMYGRLVMHFGESSARHELHLAEFNGPLPTNLLGARVEITAVSGVKMSEPGHLVGVRMAINGLDDIRVLTPAPIVPWDVPAQTIGTLMRFHPSTSFGQRTKLAGVVTLATPSGRIYIEDETGGAEVRMPPLQDRHDANGQYLNPPRPEDLRPGDRVEVLGYPTLGGFAPMLMDAWIRRVGTAGVVATPAMGSAEALKGARDSMLVRVKGRVLAASSRPRSDWTEQHLTLEEGGLSFQVDLETDKPVAAELDSVVEATGVCVVEADEWLRPRRFRVLASGPGQIAVITGAPLWTSTNLVRVAVPVGLLLGGWVWVLRRRVLREQVAHAERDRVEARLQENDQRLRQLNSELEVRVGDRTAELKSANAELMTANGQLRRTEEELQRALEAEKQLGELKSRFVSMVSHEFRTPLGIAMSAVELLRNYLDRLPAAKREELLTDIYDSTLRMSGLMEQVLLLGRVESGNNASQRLPIDLVVLLDKLADESLSACHQRCPVEVRVLGSLEGSVGDESLIRHIVSNLVSNAVKYSPEGERVDVVVRREGNDAVIEVQDRGIGIPEADRGRLFEAFHRATNVGQVPGTGLGLLIVKRCVDLHQGSIRFESVVGEGTTFTVTLPLFEERG
jgi:signal transduction histidine kinase